MTFAELRTKLEAGELHTVQVAAVDPLGRLVGKRFTGECFLRDLGEQGVTHGCNYLFAVNMEMEPQPGHEVANWESGYGDFEMKPDADAIFLTPWEPGSALVIADWRDHHGHLVELAPRTILRRQLERLAARGLTASMASELEFYLYQEDYATAATAGYASLKPASAYRIDYHLLQPGRAEELMSAIRNQMLAAGLPVENSKGEWGRGQHEINIRYGAPLETADRHTVFKQGAKHLAFVAGQSITFMAKPYAGEAGSSCHLHCSLREGTEGLFWRQGQPSKEFHQFLGGLLRYGRDLSLCFAPNVNSYKRYESLSWAPTKLAWSRDNRTTGFRVVGQGNGFRIENRMPGADANVYLAFAAMLAAGLAGLEERLDGGEEYRGNAYVDDALPALPTTLKEAAELWANSNLAQAAFGKAVVQHYAHAARAEVREYEAAVTDWERRRYFEQT